MVAAPHTAFPRSAALLLLAAALPALAACGKAGGDGTYALAPAEGFARLRQADLAAFALAEGCGAPLQFVVGGQPNDMVRWTAVRDGTPIAQFSARLVPGGGKLRAVVTLDDAGHGGLRQPLLPAIEELVDAALVGRGFDASHLPQSAGCGVPLPGLPSGMPQVTLEGSAMTLPSRPDAPPAAPSQPDAPAPLAPAPAAPAPTPAPAFGSGTAPRPAQAAPTFGTPGDFGKPAFDPTPQNPGGPEGPAGMKPVG